MYDIILGLIVASIVILFYFVYSTRQTVVVYEEPTSVAWWPWPITSYNWWPYWNGSYGGSYTGSYGGEAVHHKGPRRTPHTAPHQESRPWGGASRYANASAPSKGGHAPPSGGHAGSHGGGPSGGGHR